MLHALHPRGWRRLAVGFASVVSLALASCSSTSSPPEPPTAPMDVALDIQDQGMFYQGTARIPRGFNSATSFEMPFELAHWSHPYGGGIGFDTHAVLGNSFKATGIYQPLANETGVVSLASGRLLLRGEVRENGEELDGDWFFDGKRGGGFRIARKGVIFP
jgi:hypothetical protein